MKIKNYLWMLLLIGACNSKETGGKFIVEGDIKNLDNQTIYLEELYFTNTPPLVLDTTKVVNGKFTLKGKGSEEGLYRLRMEKVPNGYIFINDASKITFTADMKDPRLEGPKFNTPANQTLINLLGNLDKKGKALTEEHTKLESMKTLPNNDSAVAISTMRFTELKDEFINHLVSFADTTSHPVLAMFALGYASEAGPSVLDKVMTNLSSRFPNHQGVAGMITRYKQVKEQELTPSPRQTTRPVVGSIAPDFTMADPEGKLFSLSQLKGKYVLVDFWASWCGPCRRENPNVVAAYNKYKDKNFTILGVSLDENKDKWIKAIAADNLTWKQVSDLKGWSSASVSLYGFDGIPYNVLIDPQGKIIATELRDAGLEAKLAEVIK